MICKDNTKEDENKMFSVEKSESQCSKFSVSISHLII